MQWKVKAYTAISFKTHLGRFSKQKRNPSCILQVFVHKIKISIKWFLSGEFRWSLCKLKHQNIKKVFNKIYWNLANLTGDAAGKTMRLFMQNHRIGNEELRHLLETTKLILTFIQPWYWMQRLIKKLKQNAYYNSTNILAEKALILFYAFLNRLNILTYK